jgi:hypothetical protein
LLDCGNDALSGDGKRLSDQSGSLSHAQAWATPKPAG